MKELKSKETFRDVTKLLDEYSNKISSNAEKLYSDINSTEEEITNKTKNSFDEIKDSLAELKERVKTSTSIIDGIDKEKTIEESNIKKNYYSIIVKRKNEFLNYGIDTMDDIVSSFDKYNNDKKNLISIYDILVTDAKNRIILRYDEINDLVIGFLSNIKSLLEKYNSLFKDVIIDAKEKTKEISNLYFSLFSSFNTNLLELNSKSKDILLKSNDNSISISKLLGNPSVMSIESSNEAIKALTDRFNKDMKNVQINFHKKSSSLVDLIESLYRDSLSKSIPIHLLKDEFTKSLNELYHKKFDSNQIEKILLEASKTQDMRISLTYIFKSIDPELYQNTLDEEMALELDYQKKLLTLSNNKILGRYLSKTYEDSLLFEAELLKEKEFKDIHDEYFDCLLRKVELYDLFSKDELKILNLLNKYKLSFKYKIDLISLEFKKESNNLLYEFRKTLSLNEKDTSNDILNLEKILDILDKDSKRSLIDLKYELDLFDLHHTFIEAKSMAKLGYELFKKEKDLSLLEPRFKLLKIIEEHDSIKKSYKTLYDSEMSLIEKSNMRNNIHELYSFKYAYSLIKHRNIVSSELIDMAKAEYKLRIDILNDIRETINDSSHHQIERIIGKYLDKIKELDEIKEIELKSILQKIELLGNENNKERNKEIVVGILDQYETAQKKIHTMIIQDKEIIKEQMNIKLMNIESVESISSSQKIENEQLKNALSYMEEINETFKLILSSLSVNSNQFDTEVINNYRHQYLDVLEKLDESLRIEADPHLYKIKEINERYNENYYLKKYLELNDSHIKAVNDLYSKLIDDYTNLENQKSSSTQEIMNNEFIEKTNNAINLFKDSIINNIDCFNKAKDSLLKIYEEDIKETDRSLNRDIDQISKDNSLLKEKYLSIKKDIDSIGKEDLKSLTKQSKKDRKKYSFEYEAFASSYKEKLKEKQKEIENDYKNPTVYFLLKH